LAASGGDAEKHSTQPEREEDLLTAQMWWGKDDLGEWEKGLVGQEDTKRGSERKFRDVDRDVMQQRHPEPGENGVGFQLP
jgi:hypothetical protein